MKEDLRRSNFQLGIVPGDCAKIYMESTYQTDYPRRRFNPETLAVKPSSYHRAPSAVV